MVAAVPAVALPAADIAAAAVKIGVIAADEIEAAHIAAACTADCSVAVPRDAAAAAVIETSAVGEVVQIDSMVMQLSAGWPSGKSVPS